MKELRAPSVTATFAYGKHDLRTLVADSRQSAFEQARRRWGEGWIGEPCFSTPQTILRDLTGVTALEHGGDLRSRFRGGLRGRRSRRWHEGR